MGIWKPPKPRHSLGFPFYRLGGCRWRSLPTRWLILATAATCWAKPVLPRPYLALEHLCAQVGMMTIITCPPELWERHPDHDKTMMGKSKGYWGQARIRWPKYWSFSFSISPSNEYSELISFRIDWLDLRVVHGTPKSLLQHHSLKASVLRCSAFIMIQLSHPCMITGRNHSFDYIDLCWEHDGPTF